MRVLADHIGSAPTSEPDPGDHRSVAVVGAGIAGLVAAYALRRRGVNVTLYERAPHAGGAIGTTHDGGFLAEHGPNSFVTSAPVEALLDRLDLQGDVVEASATANKRFVVRRGRLEPFPLSPPAMLTTRLFSLRAKARVLLEPLVRAAPPSGEETVASFVRRRLGREVLDYAVDPFVSGIFAGDPETLSMAHAFPRVHELERRYGSLSRGLMAQHGSRGKRAAPDSTAHGAVDGDAGGESGVAREAEIASRTRLVSFVDGMQTLTDALEASLAGTVRLGCPVRLIHRGETRWEVEAGTDGAARSRQFDAIVMATPTYAMAAMELPAALRRHASPVEGVDYAPVSTLTLGFRAQDVAHPLDGFGVLVPAVERRSILGALFTSSLFEGRAPAGHVTITCFIGGARHPERAAEDRELLVQRALLDLGDLLGVRGDPVFCKHVFWPRAIPQYTVGYGAVKEGADRMESANPGLYLAGNYRNGVSVGDCVASGEQIAERVAAYLARAG